MERIATIYIRTSKQYESSRGRFEVSKMVTLNNIIVAVMALSQCLICESFFPSSISYERSGGELSFSLSSSRVGIPLVGMDENSFHRRLVLRKMSFEEDKEDNALIQGIGLVAQPIVWVSLYFVATTGAGLPPGPFGILGALEGVSYLVILGVVAQSLFLRQSNPLRPVDQLSRLTLLSGFAILASLVVDQGCVPNAKPILDYSNYLPICADTPGLFGG